MDIAFRLRTQPEKLWHLHEAVAEDLSETLFTLAKAISETLCAHNDGCSINPLLSILPAVILQESLFKEALVNINFDRKLTWKVSGSGPRPWHIRLGFRPDYDDSSPE